MSVLKLSYTSVCFIFALYLVADRIQLSVANSVFEDGSKVSSFSDVYKRCKWKQLYTLKEEAVAIGANENDELKLTYVGPKKVIIRSLKSHKYICFDSSNNWVEQLNYDESTCILNEETIGSGYKFFYKFSKESDSRRIRKLKKKVYLKFNKQGKAVKKSQKSRKFALKIKRDPSCGRLVTRQNSN